MLTRLKTILKLHWSLLVVSMVLMTFGWLALARVEDLTNSSRGLLTRQWVWMVLSIGSMLGCTMFHYKLLSQLSYTLYGMIICLLIVVLFTQPIHGVHRWFRIGSLSFQPSEFAKVIMVLAIARYLMFRENHRSLIGLIMPMTLVIVPALLIIREPDLGTALILFPVLITMLFTAGARRRDLIFILLMGLLMVPILWLQMNREQKSRITALFQQNIPGEKVTDAGFHLHQAKQMLALGGIWGSAIQGETEINPASVMVPEAATDSIIIIIGEYYGLFGISLVCVLYLILIWKGLAVAHRAREPFARLVATGISTLFATEVLINLAMHVGLAPITGIALPLISYGGSGLVAHWIAIGIVINIHKQSDYEISDDPFTFRKPDATRS